jgi:hypothetical protein
MSEVANFFSLTNIDSISAIDEWVKDKLDDNPQAVHVENEIIVRYF